MVQFRLTPDEYDRLTEACRAAGTRSVSDYVRERILAIIGTPTLESRIEALEAWARTSRNDAW